MQTKVPKLPYHSNLVLINYKITLTWWHTYPPTSLIYHDVGWCWHYFMMLEHVGWIGCYTLLYHFHPLLPPERRHRDRHGAVRLAAALEVAAVLLTSTEEDEKAEKKNGRFFWCFFFRKASQKHQKKQFFGVLDVFWDVFWNCFFDFVWGMMFFGKENPFCVDC